MTCFMRSMRFIAVPALTAALLAGCDLGAPENGTLEVSPDTAVLAIDGRLHLQLTIRKLSLGGVAFSSSDTSVAVVDASGNVQAVGYGVAYIRVWEPTQPTLRDSVRVRVPEPAGPWLLLRPDSLSVRRGTAARLSWRLGGTADTAVQFASSDTTVATVGDGGWVCAYRVGRTVIRATAASDAGAHDSSRVFVIDAGQIDDGFGLPSVSIPAIVDSAGHAVDPTAVRGTIRVDATLQTPLCYGNTAASLSFDGALWQTAANTIAPGAIVTRSFTVDTRATNATGQRLLPNGQHTLSVLLRTSTGTVIASSSQLIVVANP